MPCGCREAAKAAVAVEAVGEAVADMALRDQAAVGKLSPDEGNANEEEEEVCMYGCMCVCRETIFVMVYHSKRRRS